MKIVRTGLILLVVAFWGMSVTGYCASESGGKGREKDIEKKMEMKKQEMYKELGITEEQKKKLEENKDKNRQEMKEMFKAMKEKREALSDEIQKEKIDMAKIVKINTELKDLQGKMSDRKLATILEVRKILTPEQFKKFSAKMDDHKKKFREGKGRGHEGRDEEGMCEK